MLSPSTFKKDHEKRLEEFQKGVVSLRNIAKMLETTACGVLPVARHDCPRERPAHHD
jgi:hypothetical protein